MRGKFLDSRQKFMLVQYWLCENHALASVPRCDLRGETLPRGENSRRQNFQAANIPSCKNFAKRNFRDTKISQGENFTHRISRRLNYSINN